MTFGDDFNQPINGRIPDSVTHLTFSNNFNQAINSCIPKFVTHLAFGWNFNQSVKDCIPRSVTHLSFGYRFDKNIDELPISGNNISLSRKYKHKISKKMITKSNNKKQKYLIMTMNKYLIIALTRKYVYDATFYCVKIDFFFNTLLFIFTSG